MAKKLGEKAVFNRLERYFQASFTEEQRDLAAFHGDLEGDQTHAWKFDLENKTHVVEIDKSNGRISHRTI